MDVISRSFIAACLFWICLHGPLSLAQSNGQVHESAFTTEQERLHAEDVMTDHELADAFIEEAVVRHNTPGAVVLLVRDGKRVYNKIHGYRSIEDQAPIDPAHSLMRIGSIAKPFTGLAVLDLVEEGLLDLDADINIHFDRPLIPATYDRPVTLRHLLTHTAGFDDFNIGKSARSREDVPLLDEFVREYFPGQFIAPGVVRSYSNYGVALVGHLTEIATEQDFNAIVTQRVFEPLGMKNSTFDPGKEHSGNLVGGYYSSGGRLAEFPFDYLKDGPAGQMLTTAEDMVSFMKFATSSEELTGKKQHLMKLLGKATSMQFTHHPALKGGTGYLWSLIEYGGHNVAAHDGGYAGLASRLMLFPDEHAALFVFTNSMNTWFVSEVTNKMIEIFLPVVDGQGDADQEDVRSVQVQAPMDGDIRDGLSLRDFTGYYRDTRYSRNTMTKIAILVGMIGEMKVFATGDGYLGMPDHTGKTRRMVRTDTLLYSSIDDDYKLAFRKEDGRITHVFTSGADALEKIHFTESWRVQVSFLMFALLVFAGIVLFLGFRLAIRMIRRKHTGLTSSSLLVSLISGLFVLQIILLSASGAMLPVYERMIGFAYGVPGVFYLANLLPWAAVILMIALLARMINGEASVAAKLAQMLFFVLTAAYFGGLYYWNLVGWHF